MNETDLRETPIASKQILTMCYSYHVIPYGISMFYALYTGRENNTWRIDDFYSFPLKSHIACKEKGLREPHIVCEEIDLSESSYLVCNKTALRVPPIVSKETDPRGPPYSMQRN